MQKLAFDPNILRLIQKAIGRFVYRDAFDEAEEEVRDMRESTADSLGQAVPEAVTAAINAGNSLRAGPEPGTKLTSASSEDAKASPSVEDAVEPVDEYTAFKQKFEANK